MNDMKNKIIPFILGFALLALWACEEDTQIVTMKENVAANTLTPLSGSTYTLSYDDSDKDFETFTWSVPDYGFEAAVDYTLEIDKAESDFSDPFTLPSANNTTATMTVGELNAALLGLGLTSEEAAGIKVRVRSSVNAKVAPVYSTVVNLTVTPYATTFPPVYIVGDAQGWNLANALVLQSTGPGTYEATGVFQNNGKFRLFATPDWTAQQWGWSFFSGGTIASELSDGGDGDSNFLFGGASGYYKVTVSLKDKTIAVAAASAPTLFIIGDAQGWDLNKALEMHSVGGGEFEVIGQFQENGKFRFFVSPDWAADQYGHSFFASGTIDSKLGDGADGDSNFLFNSTTGVYKLVVNINTKTITVEATDEPTLYLIGDDQGWNLGNAFKMTWLGGGKYTGKTNFTNNAIFRFFDRPDWSAGFGNFPYFEEGTISPQLINGGGNDSNFKFTGTTGSYTITVDLYNLEVGMP